MNIRHRIKFIAGALACCMLTAVSGTAQASEVVDATATVNQGVVTHSWRLTGEGKPQVKIIGCEVFGECAYARSCDDPNAPTMCMEMVAAPASVQFNYGAGIWPPGTYQWAIEWNDTDDPALAQRTPVSAFTVPVVRLIDSLTASVSRDSKHRLSVSATYVSNVRKYASRITVKRGNKLVLRKQYSEEAWSWMAAKKRSITLGSRVRGGERLTVELALITGKRSRDVTMKRVAVRVPMPPRAPRLTKAMAKSYTRQAFAIEDDVPWNFGSIPCKTKTRTSGTCSIAAWIGDVELIGTTYVRTHVGGAWTVVFRGKFVNNYCLNVTPGRNCTTPVRWTV